MYTRLCPEGSEGASYAMLSTFGNIGLICASNLGSFLAGQDYLWDVSNTALRKNDISGLWKLNLFTSVLSVLPLTLLFLLPGNKTQQDELSKLKERNEIAGIAFLFVLITSIVWSFYCTISTVL